MSKIVEWEVAFKSCSEDVIRSHTLALAFRNERFRKNMGLAHSGYFYRESAMALNLLPLTR